MKILKKGCKNKQKDDRKGWTKIYTCAGKGSSEVGCNAKLLVSEHDMRKTLLYSDYHEKKYSVSFTCPWCGLKRLCASVPNRIFARLQEEI